MNNGYLTLSWTNIKSAIVYGLLSMFVTFSLVTGSAILSHGSIYGLDWSSILDKSAMATIGVLVYLVSLLKNLLTNDQGKFLGAVQVIPPTK